MSANPDLVGIQVQKLVSIIVPMFQEELGVAHLAKRLREIKPLFPAEYRLEFVLVDDGSSDQTYEAAKQAFAGWDDVILVQHEVNRGAGAAFRTGFQNAKGEILCTMDADCTFDPAEFPKLIEAMERTGADIGIGSPYHPEGGVENVQPWRLLLSKGASRMHRYISKSELYSYTSFLRTYRRQVIEEIPFESNGFVSVTELLMKAMLRGFTAVEVPTVLRRRVTGTSKMNVYRNIVSHLKLGAAVYRWRQSQSAERLQRSAKSARA